ncbi:hydrolase [Streptomyces longisporoflavus]|uniref:glycerophosphodiester phosphodiesterase n=1 Tax=Streptomyces longisporoflavus TaxID=28044 RepID=UPI00167C7A0C|nr:glycerophosphodiester phosphodiesterase family protein [Streptomyces longisporoflavus]GGV51176.1 hydrolase [Streptomyces longisporoflavus]
MYARVAAATTAALLGAGALTLPSATAHAADRPSAQTSASHKRPLVVAHRGASAYAPENTFAAIDKAADMGFRWVENDVQRTKDGELVIMHDDTLKRTTDVEERYPDRAPWKVADFTAKEIATLDAGSWFGPEYAGQRVPTLKQYMNRVSRNHQSLVFEFKKPELYPGIEAQGLAVLRKTGWLDRHHVKNKLVIQSFSADSVKTVHKLRPDIKTGFLGTPAVADLPEYAKFSDQINSTHTSISGEYVAAIHALKGPHRKRLEIFTWTVNNATAAQRVAGFGVDGIITNTPDVVRKAVSGRVSG